MARNMDLVEIKNAIDYVFHEYESKRVEELLSTVKGSSRIDKEDVPGILGKAQAGREIKALLYTQLEIFN